MWVIVNLVFCELFTTDEEDEEAEKKMQRLLGKVEEMKTQRETLEQQLREQIRNDDVTGDIVTKTRGSMQVRHTITHCTTPSKLVV